MSLSGQAFGAHVRYLLSAELSGEPYLRDAELTFEWRPELQVRVGRFRAPFSRQFLIPRPLLQLTDRSHVSDYFRVGRATGLSVEGRAFDGRLEYRVGVYDGASGGGPAGSVLPVARIVYAPLGASAYDETSARLAGAPRIAIGMNGYTTIATGGGTRAENSAARPERSAGGLDLALRVGRYGLLAEGFLDRRRYADGVEQFGAGAFAQAGAFVVPGALELTGRMGRLAEDVNTPVSTSATRYELGATYYLLAASVKLQTAYVYTDAASGVRDMAFASGHSAQMQVLFVH